MIGVGAVVVAVTVVLAVLTLGAGGARPAADAAPNGSAAGPSGQAGASGAPGSGEAANPIGGDSSVPPSPVPVPGHELFGYVPYWEMDAATADDLANVPLTTLALYSVTNKRDGSIDTGQQGYKRITGAVGQRMIRDAHRRKIAVQLTFTSFNDARNQRLFGAGSEATQGKVIASLVKLTDDLGFDGISVDVERLDPTLVPSYGGFVGRLVVALKAAMPKGSISVATTSGPTGASMALLAAQGGADRIFLMAYDYHYSQSDVGASAPLARRDGAERDVPWSLDLYASMGVPVEKTVLGLPLYGMRWRVQGPEIGASRLGDGAIWVPSLNPKFLARPPNPPQLDPIEIVDFYSVPPTIKPVPGDTRAAAGWQAIYVDSPRTLTPKLALADSRGLAGAGFWAIGYERGQPGYHEMMQRFRAGKIGAAP
jgi:glycosyl hydrolase family 18 (putative chitinase)